ncbi:MAG: PucR family transcriptional regulator ligand-binding domain-containing protein [Pelolinea sp.]|nr:PucR family transcriptional regulator ligand-binding domain-containing protein [Pelolinea sp.]
MTILTLREALKIEPLNRAQIIAGNKGLDNIINSVNVMEVPDIQRWVHQGELLITTLYPLRDASVQIEELIKILSDKGLSGLAVKFNRFVSPFSKRILNLADNLSFPIIELPEDIAFVDVIQSITTKILELNTKELERSILIHKQFIELVIQGGDFYDIAKSLERIINKRITIIDHFNRVLANSSGLDSVLDPNYFEKYENDTFMTHEFRPEIVSARLTDKLSSMRVKKSINANEFIYFISYPIQIGSTKLGDIYIWSNKIKPSDYPDEIALENCSASIAIKMMEKKNIHQMEDRYKNEVLVGLLSDQISIKESALRKSLEYGYELKPPFFILVINAEPKKEKKLEFDYHKEIDKTLFYIKRKIRILNSDTIFWNQGSKLIIFFPTNIATQKKGQFTIERITSSLQLLLDELSFEESLISVSIGISTIGTDLMHFDYAYKCALQSLFVSPIFINKPEGKITYFGNLGIFRLISIDKGQSVLEDFCKEALGELIYYDKENGTDLLKTLKVYFDNNQNVDKSAKSLFVHYNTLRYRLNRILEVQGNIFESPDKRIATEIALQLYSILYNN